MNKVKLIINWLIILTVFSLHSSVKKLMFYAFSSTKENLSIMKKSYLIELKNIQEFKKFFILFIFLQLDVVLLKPMQCQFCFIINIHFHWLLTEGKEGWKRS
jgi:hypothetical protein